MHSVARPPKHRLEEGISNHCQVIVTDRKQDFVGALESVRGFAALTVLIFHSTMFLTYGKEGLMHKTLWQLKSTDELLRRSVHVFFNGHIAVSLFFVLSGFVLALSLRRDDRTTSRRTFGFVGRRFFRIYPTLAINILVTAALIAGSAFAFPTVGYASFTWGKVVENLMLHSFLVNGATWTLLIEMLAIPLILVGHLLTKRFGTGGLLMLTAITILVLFNPGWARRLAPGDSLYFVRAYIVDYQFMFVFGMLITALPLQNFLENKQRVGKVGLFLALVIMLNARFLLGYASRWSLLFEGAAAASLIALLAYSSRLSVHNLLEWRPIRFLGRISYSLYLYHATVLALIIPASIWYMTPSGAQEHPFPISGFVALTATLMTIPVAWLSYYLIEQPMIQLGRRF